MKKQVFRLAVLSVLTLTAMSCRKNYYYDYSTVQYQTEQDNGGVISGDVLVSKDGTKLVKWQNSTTQSLDMESHPVLKNIKVIEASAFEESNITHIILPKQLERIESKAFLNSKLTSIEIPESVIYIGNSAFQQTPLENLKLTENVKEIKDDTFSLTELTSVEIPEGVEKIGYSAFGGLKVDVVVLPSTLKEMMTTSFSNKAEFYHKKVVINAITPPTIANWQYIGYTSPLFSLPYFETNLDFEIRVPAESVEAYKTATGWSQYANYIVAQEEEN